MPATQIATKVAPKYVKRPLVAKEFAVEDIARVRTAVDVVTFGGVTRDVRASDRVAFAIEDDWLAITCYMGTNQHTGMPESIQTCRIHTQYCVFEMKPEPAIMVAGKDA